MISELKDKAKTLSQQNTHAEVEIESLRERYRCEIDTVVRPNGAVSSIEAVRMELVERLRSAWFGRNIHSVVIYALASGQS